MILRRIDPMSCAKALAVIQAVFGLIGGLLFFLFGLVIAPLQRGESAGGAAVLFGLGIGGVILAPIFYAVLGFILGWLGSLLYNFVASRFGGIELDFTPSSNSAPPFPSATL